MTAMPADELSLAQLVDVSCDRFEASFAAGKQPTIEDFLGDTVEPLRSHLFRSLIELELELRRRAGESLAPEGYLQRFPDWTAMIQQAFQELEQPARSVRESPAAASSANVMSAETSRVCPTPTPAHTLAIPESIARFRILSLLGQGAFGAVYRARDPQLDRDVAIKVLQSSTLATEEERERFLREARAAAGLHHPHICPVHEVGTTTDGRDYIVMAFIDGKPLSKLIQSGSPIGERQIAGAIRKLALALDEAHQKGVIHRDLKPANIMINRKGEPVIMDFGLARRSNPDDPEISRSGQIMGTPAYMSPEQARGDSKQVGPGSDIYSLGVVMYELLCGRRPFQGTVTEVLGQILHVEVPPPSSFREGVDSRLQTICMKAIAKLPRDRYGSMKDFAAALADYQKSSVATAKPTSTTTAEPLAPDEPLPTKQLARIVAAVSSDVEEKVERAARRVVRQVKKARPPKPPPFWVYLAGCGLMGAVLLLGILFFVRAGDTTILIQVPLPPNVDLADTTLAFFLDQKQVAAEQIGKPIELTPGEHELLIKRGDIVVERLRFAVRMEGNNWNIARLESELAKDAPLRPQLAVAPFTAEQAEEYQQAWARHLGVPVEATNSIGMKFRLIPAGEFMMGAPESELGRWPNEGPQETVTIADPYFLGTHEVTQAEFEKLMGTNPSHVLGPDLPVGWVQWTEAKEFCRRLSELPAERAAQRAYRLPFEREWEFACRAGTTSAFLFGDSLSLDQANFNGYDGDGQKLAGSARGQPIAVGSFPPNPWNLFDLHGNVPEWCQNLLEGRNSRAIRGGGWNKDAGRCRSAYRAGDFHLAYTPRVDLVGFRVVMVSHVGALPDVDRAAAEWATTAGVQGTATLVFAGNERIVQPGESLPNEAFSVVALSLSQGNRAGDTVLGRLSSLPELRSLDLQGQPITDGGLHHLYSLKSLLTLNLSGTAVTPAGLRALQVALPRCDITPQPPQPNVTSDFVSLFNGNDLAGWQGDRNLWSIQDGILTGRPKSGKTNSFLFSPRPYGNFELHFQVRVGPNDNSGLQIRSEILDSSLWTARGPQCDFGNRPDDLWGGVYGENVPGGWLIRPQQTPMVKTDDWNDYSVRCVGRRITIEVNGTQTVDDELLELKSSGYLGFQIHSKNQQPVEFRNLVVREF